MPSHLWQRRRARPLRLLPLALAWLAAPLAAYDSDPETVDQSVAIAIGDHAVSRYIIDKNYNFHLAQRRGAEPSAEEKAAWFRAFLARQGHVAELRAKGYADEPEVRRAVSQMERYILTQDGGPLYAKLLAESATPGDTRAELADAGVEISGAALRFESAEQARAALGEDFETLAPAERARRIASAPESAAAARRAGRMMWPFHPFHEIRRELAGAAPGEASGLVVGKLGFYAFAVEEARRLPTPGDPARLEGFAAQLEASILREARARALLRERGFETDDAALAALAAQLARAPADYHTIDAFALAALGDAALCRYKGEAGEARAVGGREFAGYFNALMIRSLPRSPEDLKRALEDLVVAEADLAEARRLGCDREPRFVEDRRNFEDNQIVDLYERRVLAPQLEPADAELRAHYDARSEEFVQVNASEVTLLLFDTAEEAARHAGPDHASAEPASESRVVTIRKDGASEPLPIPSQALLGLPAGQRIGPFPVGEKFATLVKQTDSEVGRIPFEIAAEGIRQRLLRERLDARLAALPLPAGLVDNIDYAAYGLPGKPYASGAPGASAAYPAAPSPRM